MKLLLDTHAFLWAIGEPNSLAPEARKAIVAAENRVFVSAISVWEIAIKASLGRLRVPRGISDWIPIELERGRFDELPFTVRHAAAVGELPRHHDDPFDRALVAQASLEGMALVTRDRRIAPYGIATLTA